MPLTKREIDAFRHEPGGPAQQVLFDGGALSGFGVRVFPSGRKSFVVWYRNAAGRKRLHTLGRYGELTLANARKLAAAALVSVRNGSDPAELRKQRRKAETVRDLAKIYLERHAKQFKKSWKDDERQLRLYVLPVIGHRAIRDIKRADIARIHSSMGDRSAGKRLSEEQRRGRGARFRGGGPYEANRTLQMLSSMFNKAKEWGILPEDAPNPAARIQRFRERSRDRFVSSDELPKLLDAIDAESSPFVRAAFRMYLHTGLRRSELAGLRWTSVDLDRAEIRLPDTKAGRPHILPLSGPAVVILRHLPRGLNNEFVFQGSRPGRPLDVKVAWLRIRKRANLPDVRLHDVTDSSRENGTRTYWQPTQSIHCPRNRDRSRLPKVES